MMAGECILGCGGISMLLEDYFREHCICVFGLNDCGLKSYVQNIVVVFFFLLEL